MPPVPFFVPVPFDGQPLLRWVGGKARMLERITGYYTGQRRVLEPFFGGGALSFHLAMRNPALEVVANDEIAAVMEIYETIRSGTEPFLTDVARYAGAYLRQTGKDARRKNYYKVRLDYMTETIDGPAPLFFLLWCAYSGMYRTGKTYPGRFNTPHGFGVEKPGFYHPERVRAAAPLMRNWELSAGDFAKTLHHADADTFVFLDPPYRDTFQKYQDGGFSDDDQLRVIEYFKAADAQGAKVLYTNKYTDDGFYEQHFAGYQLDLVPIRYQVNRNCASAGRPRSLEVFVSN